MTEPAPIIRLWPDPSPEPLDFDDLATLYGRPASPSLRVNFVSSADGATEIAGYSEGLSGEPDKRVFGVLRMLCDALLVGAGTLRHERYHAVRLDERRRAWRRAHGLADYPTLIVVSESLDLDPAQSAFADAPVRPLILTNSRDPVPAGLAAVTEVLRFGDTAVDLPAALTELRRRGLSHLLCEGGPQLFGSLVAADVVDELCLTLSPLLAGAGAGRIIAGPPAPVRRMTLRHVLTSDDMLLLRYTR